MLVSWPDLQWILGQRCSGSEVVSVRMEGLRGRIRDSLGSGPPACRRNLGVKGERGVWDESLNGGLGALGDTGPRESR